MLILAKWVTDECHSASGGENNIKVISCPILQADTNALSSKVFLLTSSLNVCVCTKAAIYKEKTAWCDVWYKLTVCKVFAVHECYRCIHVATFVSHSYGSRRTFTLRIHQLPAHSLFFAFTGYNLHSRRLLGSKHTSRSFSQSMWKWSFFAIHMCRKFDARIVWMMMPSIHRSTAILCCVGFGPVAHSCCKCSLNSGYFLLFEVSLVGYSLILLKISEICVGQGNHYRLRKLSLCLLNSEM